MRTLRRVLIGLAVVLLVAVVGLWLGGRALLNTASARAAVASRITAAVGLPVSVDDLSVGVGSSSAAFRVFDSNAPDVEVLKVDAVETDVSALDAILGRANPTRLAIRGAHLTIRIDRDGRVLTGLPKASGDGKPLDVPPVELDGFTLALAQEGRPPFVMSNIRGKLTTDAGKLVLTATAADPKWGDWSADGSVDPASKSGSVVLTNADGAIDMEALRSIPYVPADTWNHVRLRGRAAAKVTLGVPAGGTFEYAVEITSAGKTDVEVPDIEATITALAGTVRVSGQQVKLADVKGSLADGRVTVGGDLDFAPEPSALHFRVATEGVQVSKLPAAWGLPKKLDGKLKGRADIRIGVPKEGRPAYHGTGAAAVEGATVAGIPAEIGLKLRGDGKRLRIESGDAPKLQNRGAGVVVRPPVKARSQQPAADEPTTLDATITLRDVDVAELLTKLEVKVPYKLAGRVTVSAKVTIPVAQADQSKAYKFAGTLVSPDFRFEGFRVTDLAADVSYADGKLTLKSLRGKTPAAGGEAGSFKGTATAAVQPPGDVSASLDLDRVPLGEVLKLIPGAAIDVAGPVSGTAELRGPWPQLGDPSTWTGSANLRSAQVTAYGRVAKDVVLPIKADRGTATITAAKATIEGVPLSGGGTAGLKTPYPFQADVKTTAVALADLRKLVPELSLPFPVEGKLKTDATVKGTGSPVAFTASGTATADDLTVGTRGANALELGWAIDAERVKVTKLAATVFGGTISGTADVPFAATKAGKFDVTFKAVDAEVVSKTVPDLPVRLSGRVSGDFKGTLPAAEPGKPRTPTADLDLTAPKLTVQGIPAERLTGKVGFAGGAAEYHLEGKTLGGSFELKGRYPSKPKAAAPVGKGGSVQFRGIDLKQLAGALKQPSLGPLAGAVDLSFEYADDLSDGDGRLLVRGLRWGQDTLAEQVAGVLRLRAGVLELQDLSGQVAGGLLRGRGRLPLDEPTRNYFTLTLDRADPKRLLAPVGAGDVFGGEIGIVFRGRVGAESRGSGVISVDRDTVAGLAASELRVPFDWAVGAARTEVSARDVAGRLGGGRVTGTLAYTAADLGKLTGQVQFSDVRLAAVLGSGGLFGSGRATGRFDVSAAPFRSADDLSGRLTATLNQTSVREIPVLRVIAPYLAPTGLVSPFQSGEVRGRLARGVFRLERLDLSNPAAQLHAEGSITLAGRLDLDVVARTGQLDVTDRALAAFGLRIPAFGPIPVTLLRDISTYLSNRTVRLAVTGTAASPQVRVNTAAILSEEAVRFLLTRYIPIAGTGSLLGEATKK